MSGKRTGRSNKQNYHHTTAAFYGVNGVLCAFSIIPYHNAAYRSRSAAATATFHSTADIIVERNRSSDICRVRRRRFGKIRSRFHLLAERRRKPQAPLRCVRLRKKYATLFCCVNTLECWKTRMRLHGIVTN